MGYQAALDILKNPLFIYSILDEKVITYTSDMAMDVAAKYDIHILKSNQEIEICPYYHKNINVVAMTKGDGSIYVNLNGADTRSKLDYIGNALHELAHFPLGYSHGSNFPPGLRSKLCGDFSDKRKSVPYLFEKIGLKIARDFDH